MKILVATRETQGLVPGDFSWTVEGELVRWPLIECASGRSCGCERSFPGLASHRATTTVKVVELEALNRAGLVRALLDDLVANGITVIDDEARRYVEDEADDLARVASFFPTGTVLGRGGDQVWARAGAAVG